MKSDDFIEQLTLALSTADALQKKKHYKEALGSYQNILGLLRDVERVQKEKMGGDSLVPISLGMIAFHELIVVLLDRFAGLYLKIGDYVSALECLREVVTRLEKATALSGGDTKRAFEEKLSRARQRLAEGEETFLQPPVGGTHWVAYRGDDTAREIRVFTSGDSGSTERLRLLLLEAARHQHGEVSCTFEADTEAQAQRMAPYQFGRRI